MKNVIGLIFLMPFSFLSFAAERPEQSPFITRGKALGNTGALSDSDTPRPHRANSSSSGSLKRASTIRVTLPRKTSNEEGKRTFHRSPRSELEFNATRSEPVVLPAEPFDFSKKPEPKAIPSYGYAEKK